MVTVRAEGGILFITNVGEEDFQVFLPKGKTVQLTLAPPPAPVQPPSTEPSRIRCWACDTGYAEGEMDVCGYCASRMRG